MDIRLPSYYKLAISLYQSVCLSVCLSIYLSIYVSIYPYLSMEFTYSVPLRELLIGAPSPGKNKGK